MPADNKCFEIICSNEMEIVDKRTLEAGVITFDGRIKIAVPLESIGCTNDPADIAADLADALYVGESLSRIFIKIDTSRGKIAHKK